MSQESPATKPFEARPRFPHVALALALIAAIAGVARTFARDDRDDDRDRTKEERYERGEGRHGPGWRMIGHDPANTRNQPFEREIGVENVGHLAAKWVATTTGDVSATPAVANGAVYFGDFGGTLWMRRPARSCGNSAPAARSTRARPS